MCAGCGKRDAGLVTLYEVLYVFRGPRPASRAALMVLPEFPALILARVPLRRRRFGWDPRRAFLDRAPDVRRPVELRIQVFGRRLSLWADADGPIAEQTSLGPLLVDEIVVRGFGAQ